MSTPVPPPGLYREPSAGVPALLPTLPPQASDPAVLATGQVIPRHLVPAPVGGGGAFSIDLERAPQVLRDLRDAVAQLNDLRRDAFQLGKVDPGTNDLVSRDVAAVLGAVAVGGVGSLVDAVTAGIERLEGIVSAIEQEIRSYKATDEHATRSFGLLP